MVSIKISPSYFIFKLLLLISLCFIIAETRYYDGIVYPDDEILSQLHSGTFKTMAENMSIGYDDYIPDEFIEEINSIANQEELDKYFFEDDSLSSDDSVVMVRFGGRTGLSDEENRLSYPKVPLCQPRDTLVPVKSPKPGLIPRPLCLIVPRCGACCFFGWTCTPTATKKITYSIQLTKYINDTKKLKALDRFEVSEEHHTACQCQCNVKPENCHKQDKVFDNKNCKCVCRNDWQRRHQCHESGLQWNSDSCTCDCPVVTCDEGYFFDKERCKCDF